MADKLDVRIVPFAFPNKGKYRTWDSAWNPTGYADEAQYAGQQPLRYPAEWSPLQCFMANREVLKPWRLGSLIAALRPVFA